MLSIVEKLLFLLLAVASLLYALFSWRAVYQVIRRGTGDRPTWGESARRGLAALTTWLVERPIWRTRRITSVFHVMIAWGFVFYFLVNLGDVIQALFPVTFLGHNLVGNLYRLLADLFTVSVLVGMV